MSGPTSYSSDGKELFTEEKPAIVQLADLMDYINEMRDVYENIQELYQKIEEFYPGSLEALGIELTDKIDMIRRDLYLVDGEDATSKIQNELNKKGHIRIVTPGTFLTGRLLIDDNTTLELLSGVVLKKKNATNHYILVNKGHVNGYRNKNICIKGGKWDMNKAGNVDSGGNISVDPQAWSGIGILFKGVDNLKIEDIEQIGNEYKYCFLIADVSDVKVNNVKPVNDSDGIHFQPPLRNLKMTNIEGLTHDDLISFTMGDYARYAISSVGDIENVVIENVYGREGSISLLKMVGSGVGSASVFKNISVKNMAGWSERCAVWIMTEDLGDGVGALKDTHLQNVVIENVKVKTGTDKPLFIIGGKKGNVTLKNFTMEQSATVSTCILLKDCNLDKVIIENPNVIKSDAAVTPFYFVQVDNTTNYANVVKNLLIRNGDIKLKDTLGGFLVWTKTNSRIESLTLEKMEITGSQTQVISMSGVDTVSRKITIANSNINTQYLIVTSMVLDVKILNSVINVVTRTLQLADGSNIRVRAGSSDFLPTFSLNAPTTANRIVSLTGSIKTDTLLTSITGQFGDQFLYDRSTDQSNKGLYFYNGTAFVKIA